MGYLLPIRPIQSEMYANRMENSSNSFAYIDKVESAKLRSEYEDWQNRLHREQEQKQQQEQRNSEDDIHEAEAVAEKPPLSPAKNGFVQPNPAELSKQVAAVVGKGNAINEYV